MKHAITGLLALCLVGSGGFSQRAGPDANAVWKEFVAAVKGETLTPEQSRLRENLVVLEKLTNEEAVVSLQTHFFFLYKRATHPRQWIPFEEYKQIFETIWQDRAQAAGWNLAIEYKDPECLQVVLHFTSKNSAPAAPQPTRDPQ